VAKQVQEVLDRNRRAPEQVYEYLQGRILTGVLAPGENINERGLTERLGVSRTPIREALRRLVDDGLIEVIPSVGSRVAQMDPKRICDLAEVRIELECHVIRRAAANFSTASDRELEALIDAQQATVEADDYVTNIRVDSQFHRSIWGLAGTEAVSEMLDRALSEILRARHLSIKLPGRLGDPIQEHRAILTALRKGDASASESAMREHLTKSFHSIVDVARRLGS